MLGSEEVEICEKLLPNGYKNSKSFFWVVKCKGKSVTKEEWLKWHREESSLIMIKAWCGDPLKNITLDQIEAITKALNEL